MLAMNTQALPNGLMINSYKINVPGVKKKILYHFSDTHLAAIDELSTEQEKQKEMESTAFWLVERILCP